MRKLFAFIILLSSFATAQDKLMAATENGKAYFTKKVAAGETIFSLGRHYSIAPKELAGFNKIDIATGLKTGQSIKVPLTKANLLVSPCTICVKVFYVVPPKEGLFRIAANFNNVALSQLKSMNSLTTDNVNIGKELLVGYLKDGEEQAINVVEKKEEKVVPPAPKLPLKTVAIEKAEPLKELVEKTNVAVEEVKVKILDEGMTSPDTKPEFLQSAFASQYVGKNPNGENGISAIFKSTSGWNDYKYYVLMSNVTPGTIVKVTATRTNKVLYAKVLAELPPMKQNDYILVRISNAAAAVLGGGEEMEVMVSH